MGHASLAKDLTGAGTPRRRRRFGRWLAPLALALAIGAIAVIADVVLSKHPHKTPAPRTTTIARSLPHYWTVRAGNTLAGISARTGLSVAAIERDNPRMNRQVIVPGERLDLWSRSGVRTSAQ